MLTISHAFAVLEENTGNESQLFVNKGIYWDLIGEYQHIEKFSIKI